MSNCPYCGKLTDLQLDSCVHCGGFLKKQAGRPGRPGAQTSQTCPSCGALVREGDIICVACGTNLLTGQKIADEKKAAPSGGGPSVLPVLLGLLAIVLLVVVGALAYFVFFRDPVSRAQSLREEGKLSEAVKLLEDEIQRKPDHAKAHMELGKVYWAANDYAKAGASFEKVYRVQSANLDAAWFAVLGYANSQAANAQDSVAAVLELILTNEPGNQEARYLLASVRGNQGRYGEQAKALDQMLAANPNNAKFRRSLGIANVLDGNAARGEAVLQQSVVADGNDANAKAALGVAQAMQGKLADARAQLQEAINGNTSVLPQALTELGILLAADGKFGEALPLLNDAVAKGEASPAAKYFRAVCMARQRQGEQALTEFESLIRAKGPFATQAAAQSGLIQLEKGDADAALRAVDSAPTGGDPSGEAELQTVRGRAHLALGNPSGAMEAFRNAMKADESYAPAQLEMGLALLQAQQMDEGMRRLERYLSLVNAQDSSTGASEIQALLDQLRKTTARGATAVGRAETQTERGL